MNHLHRSIEEAIVTLRSLAALEEPLQHAAKLLARCLISGKKLLVCGNGGSASDATHLATEFLCRFKDDRRPYPAISLTANGEFMTAVCNDYHADEIFARQVWGLAEPSDDPHGHHHQRQIQERGPGIEDGPEQGRGKHRYSGPRRRLHQGHRHD